MVTQVKFRLRAVRAEATTSTGTIGRTLQFVDGLNVLRADNSSGKSLCMQAIVYGLGLEGALSPSRGVPLPHAMMTEINTGDGDEPVLESRVWVEIENAAGEVMCAARYATHPSISTSVISVAEGPAITQPGDYDWTDHFVRLSGSAQRELGFHHHLAQFVGWVLPRVSRMDGGEGPLYMETLFPYFYVEQKTGWSGIARVPTYLRIRDAAKRSAEFILGLDAFDRALTEQRLRAGIAVLDADWKAAYSTLRATASTSVIELQRPPVTAADCLKEGFAEPVTYVDGEWLSLDRAIERLRNRLDELESTPVSTVQAASGDLERNIVGAEHTVASLLQTLGVLIDERNEYMRRRSQLDLRIDALQEDFKKHKDAMLLVRLGGEALSPVLSEHRCPTCHQELADGLEVTDFSMSADENSSFISKQLGALRSTRGDVDRMISALEVRETSVRDQLAGKRREVRALRDTLLSPDGAPSLADVSMRVGLRDRLERLAEAQEELAAVSQTMRELAERRASLLERLEALGAGPFSEADQATLQGLETRLRDQLRRYHFSSIDINQIEISRDTYRPAHRGLDLGFDLSASDLIRVIWSYLMSVMSVTASGQGNHPGLLIFDEPRQQETATHSFRELIQEAAEQGLKGSQVIFTTSETSVRLAEMIEGTSCNLIDVPTGERVLHRE